MAKRRRLIPSPQFLDELPELDGSEAKPTLRPPISAPPIAHVAAEASTRAALDELSDAMGRARNEGRLVLSLPLESVDPTYLVRDRLAVDAEEMEGLVASIRNHGQRTPIEVTEIGEGRYGLISGWRRYQAARALAQEAGDEGRILALLRRPEADSQAYIAMVEENEVRQGLSYYERARIAAKAVDLGVFATEKVALQQLYASASRAKRSKIGSFLALYRALDDHLRYPAAISERLGLALEKLLEDPAREAALRARLKAAPAQSAEAEIALLTAALKPEKASAAQVAPTPLEVASGVFLSVSEGKAGAVLQISGPKVDQDFRRRLEAWLRG